MSDARIVKFEDLPDYITKHGGKSQQIVKVIIEENGKGVLYNIEFNRTDIPF